MRSTRKESSNMGSRMGFTSENAGLYIKGGKTRRFDLIQEERDLPLLYLLLKARGSRRRSRGRVRLQGVYSGCIRRVTVGLQWVCSRGRVGLQGVYSGCTRWRVGHSGCARAGASGCHGPERVGLRSRGRVGLEGERGKTEGRRRAKAETPPPPTPRSRGRLAPHPQAIRPRRGPAPDPRSDPARRPPRGPRGGEPRHDHEKSRRIGLTLSRS